ncbi:hypothetical protein JXA02_10350, partial [candidate division KSB1 bacterium]|nr:hypothetical protein [candidate division KSB1 bacterium]
DYIASSLDSFPIEFLNLKLHHKLLFGQDLLSPLEIEDSHLRLKCEEQLKSKLLHLWEDFVETQGKKGPMRRLLIETVPTLSSIFIGLIVMKKANVPDNKEDIIISTARLYGLDESVFQRVVDVRIGSAKLSQKEIQSTLQSYISEMSKLADIVDQWVN